MSRSGRRKASLACGLVSYFESLFTRVSTGIYELHPPLRRNLLKRPPRTTSWPRMAVATCLLLAKALPHLSRVHLDMGWASSATFFEREAKASAGRARHQQAAGNLRQRTTQSAQQHASDVSKRAWQRPEMAPLAGAAV